MAIDVVEYDRSWAERAESARSELMEALPGLFSDLEHVGSTSVPGLAAKPIIDLMVSVNALSDIGAEAQTTLERLGYQFEDVGMSNRLFYHRQAGGRRSHHLHIVTADTFENRNERIFRDHLLTHPQVAAEYGELKKRLAAQETDGLAYTKAKTELIQRVVDSERTARGLPLVTVWEE